LRHEVSVDPRSAPTYVYLKREQRILVQDELIGADPAPPKELIEVYGTRAQMLAPVMVQGKVVGIISVHDGPDARRWTDEDVAALRQATDRVEKALAPGG
jgi:maleate isomerase